MKQETLEVLNFHEWWEKYNETHNHATGGREWMAAFAAWQYCEIMIKQKLDTPVAGETDQSCPDCYGSGNIGDPANICIACNGHGVKT